MKPKFRYTSEADIPAALKPFYIQSGTDWVLDVDGGAEASKVKEFRDTNTQLKSDLDALKAKYAGIEDPELARELLTKADDLKNEKLMKKGDLDAAVASRMDAAQKAHKAALDAVEARAKTAEASVQRMTIQTAVLEEASKHGLRPTAAADLIARASQTFTLKDGKLVATGPDGKERYAENGIDLLTPADWIKNDALKNAPHLFEASQGAGSGGTGGQKPPGQGTGGVNPWDPKAPNVTAQSQLYRTDPANARRLAAMHGVTLP